MKNFVAVFIAVLMIALSACGRTTEYYPMSVGPLASSEPNAENPRAEIPAEDMSADFTADETRAMSQFMIRGRYIIENGVIYGTLHSADNGAPNLCRMVYAEGDGTAEIVSYQIFDAGADAEYLSLYDSFLYYIRSGEAVCRTGENGTGMQILYKGPADYLQIRGGRLYFTDSDANLVSCQADGSDLRAEFPGPVYFPYFINASWLMYQSDSDGESLCIRNMNDGSVYRISDGRVYEYCISGTQLYFSWVDPENPEGEKELRSVLCRTDLAGFFDAYATHAEGYEFTTERSGRTMGTRFSINGDHINASNYQLSGLEEWDMLGDNVPEKGIYSAVQGLSERYEIFFGYDSGGLVEDAVMYDTLLKKTVCSLPMI